MTLVLVVLLTSLLGVFLGNEFFSMSIIIEPRFTTQHWEGERKHLIVGREGIWKEIEEMRLG